MHDYRTIKIANPCLTTIKNHVIKYCEKVYERSGKNLFWSIKNSCEVLNKLKSRGFRASSLSTYDFSTLYTTLTHNLDLIERTFQREIFHANQTTMCLRNQGRTKGEGWSTAN